MTTVHIGARELILSTVEPGCLSLEPGAESPAPPPTRGVCRCGHVMSMHCHADCSGPCAEPGCQCAGAGS
jgi:hypothetical protein